MCRKLATSTLTCLALAAPSARANVVGNDAQLFNPVTGAADFVTVQSSATLAPGRFSLGLFLDDAANSLPYAHEPDHKSLGVNDSLVGMGLGVGFGLLPHVELSAALPFMVRQTVDDDSTRGEFAQRGNTAARLAIKWAFLSIHQVGLALVGSTNVDRTQDDPHTGTATSPVYTGELAADTHTGPWSFGANLGYRLRPPGQPLEGALIDPLGNQLLASLATSYAVTARTSLIAETYGARPVGHLRNDTDRSSESAEALLGARYSIQKNLVVHAGLGLGLLRGLSTPDRRAYVGVVTTFGPGGPGGHTVAAHHHKRARRRLAKIAPVPSGDDFGALPASGDDNDPQELLTNEQAIAQVPQREADEVFIIHNINFAFDSDFQVLPGAVAELRKLAQHLVTHPYSQIVIEGHCDYYGSDSYNDDLSMRRARTIRRYLIQIHHFDAKRLIAVGYGKRRPMTKDTSDYGRQLNRRVEVKVFYATPDLAH